MSPKVRKEPDIDEWDDEEEIRTLHTNDDIYYHDYDGSIKRY